MMSLKTMPELRPVLTFEYGKQSVEIYHEIDEIAKKYSGLKYNGSISSDFNTMKCIDFIHDRELNELIKRRVEK